MYADSVACSDSSADLFQRKIDGSKLCAVIAKDVVRVFLASALPIWANALQHKRIPPKPGHKAALRDPGVELDVSGKAISDEGFAEVTSALAAAIKHHDDQGRVLRLEEACLKGNLLTVKSLAHLADVIHLSASEMRDLDLSNNRIQVTTPAEATAWERFLHSFARCCVLRRLDLSGNPLGFKGYEILLKVYAQENEWNETEPNFLRGLRSVPYIVLSDTCMNDVSAMHLSYIIANHRLPHQLLPLVPLAKAGAPTQQLEAYDQVEGCRGIIWQRNEELETAGTRVLELAEATRLATYDPTVDSEADPSIPTELMDDLRLTDLPKTATNQNPPVTPISRHRRDSAGTPLSSVQQSPALNSSELDRARSRIQGDTLKDQGLRSNDLWLMSIRMLRYARIILLEPRQGYANQILFASSPSPLTIPCETRPTKLKRAAITGDTFESHEAFPLLSSTTSLSTPTPKRPLGNGNPNSAIIPKQPSARKNSLIHHTASTPFSTMMSGATNNARRALPPLQTQISKAQQMVTAQYRSDLPGGLPGDIWAQILGHVVDAHGILHPSQQQAVARWGMERATLSEERGALGKVEAAQIWRVLLGMR